MGANACKIGITSVNKSKVRLGVYQNSYSSESHMATFNYLWYGRNSPVARLEGVLKDTFGYAILNYSDVFNKINFEQFDTRDITVNLTLLNDNNLKKFNEPYHIAHTPWFVSQGFYTKEQNKDRLSNGLHLKDRVLKLFKIHSINPGKLSNNIIIKINRFNYFKFSSFYIN